MTSQQEALGAVTRTLAERGITLTSDEMEELAIAYPVLLDWAHTADDLAEGEPAFLGLRGDAQRR